MCDKYSLSFVSVYRRAQEKKVHRDGEAERTPCLFSLFYESTMFWFDCKWTHTKGEISQILFLYFFFLYDHK